MARIGIIVASWMFLLGESVRVPSTDEEKTLYAIGYLIGSRNLATLELTPSEIVTVERGLREGGLDRRPSFDIESQMENINRFTQERSDAGVGKEKKAGREYLANAALETGAVKLASGLVYRTLAPGTGQSPAASDKVKVNYEGRLINGTVFDSSYKRGQPAEFGLNQVIACWTEGVQRMKIGEKAHLVCPSETAYGDHGHPPAIPGGSTLIFDVELLGISR